jgi:5'-3' exonuclease
MGVPGFFLWLMKNYKKDKFIFNKANIQDSESSILHEINSINYILIDANCLIHPVCYKVLADNPTITDNDILEHKMIHAIFEYLEKIISHVNPNKGIYLAIDGVAPVAKIKQQRSRRFKSLADKAMWDNLKKKYNKPLTHHWNSNAITPGTEFMVKLHSRIIDWAKTYKKHIIYSSCFTPAEGEHKLLQFIRQQQEEKHDFSYVIYGLDADLIFLALATESDKIYLLREANEINKQESKEVLNHVSIKIMKLSIINTIKSYLSKTSIGELLNDTRLVNDFIFMCYFLGNDFLPHIPSLDIHKSGIESLIVSYADTMTDLFMAKKQIYYLLDDKIKSQNKINITFLTLFINKLALLENDILIEHFNAKRRFFRSDGDAYEKDVAMVENVQFKVNDPIQLGSGAPEHWRKRYYKHYWGVADDELEEFSQNIVRHYLMGLKWVTLYYFDECPSWDWYYPYDYPPFISDISKYLDSANISKIKFTKGTPLKPFMQLLSVLPPQSNNLLPKSLQHLMVSSNSPIIYLYPREFIQDFINKKRYWMGIPKLPPLDIDMVKKTFNKYKNKLTIEENSRNTSINPFQANPV